MNNLTAKKKNIDLIDLLKGFAILSVIYLHSGFSDTTSKVVLSPFLFNLAVPIFMIVSGFTYSFSLSKMNSSNQILKSYYSFGNLYKKLVRIIPCYLIVFIIEIICSPYHFTDKKSVLKFIYYLCTGGYIFPGSYYIPVLIQLIIIFPVLKILYDKIQEKAFIPLIIFQLIYELTIHYLNIPTEISRLLIIRYLAFILSGIFIFEKYYGKKKISKTLCIAGIISGAVYIITIGYFDFTPKVVFATWTNTALPVALYLVPVIMLLLFKFGEKEVKPIFTIIGKASYHIYLMQMLYFGIIVFKLNLSKPLINCIIGTCFSVLMGLIMYFIENKITKIIKSKHRNKCKDKE